MLLSGITRFGDIFIPVPWNFLNKLVYHIYRKQNSHLITSLGHITTGSFIMRSYKYSMTPKNETEQMRIVWKEDFYFNGSSVISFTPSRSSTEQARYYHHHRCIITAIGKLLWTSGKTALPGSNLFWLYHNNGVEPRNIRRLPVQRVWVNNYMITI